MNSLQRIKLKIADVIIELKSRYKMEQLTKEIDWRFKNFITQDKTRPDIRLQIELVKRPPTVIKARGIFMTRHPDGGKLNWALFRRKNQYLLKQYIPRNRQLIVLNSSFDRGIIYLLSKKNNTNFKWSKENNLTWKIEDIIYDALQIILINYLSQRDSIFLHAIGLKDVDKKGVLFVGPTRSGKSTMARLWHKFSRALILNDDRIILRKFDGRFFIYGSPWHGNFSDYLASKQERARLKQLFFIHHNPKNLAASTTGTEAFNLLYPNTLAAFWDKSALEKSFIFCQELIEKVPCFRLGFKNDKGIIEFARKLRT